MGFNWMFRNCVLKYINLSSSTLLFIFVVFNAMISSVHAEIQFYYYNPDSPQYNLSKLKRDMDLALEAINKSTGQSIVFQPFSRLVDFDKQLRERKPAIVYIPYWYLETYGQELNLKALLYAVRNNKSVYQKKLITNKVNTFKIQNLKQKSMALTTMGPRSESILNQILLLKHNINASELSLVEIPKDTDAIFAVALGQVDSALVTSSSLNILERINPRITATVHTIAISQAIRLPVLCYIEGVVSQQDLKIIKQQFLQFGAQGNNSIVKVLQIDAWSDKR